MFRPPFACPPPARLAISLVLALFGALLLAEHTHAQSTWHVDDTVNDGLVAHWKLDNLQVTLSTTLDFVGTAHGTIFSGAALGAGTVAPLQVPNPGAFSFNGVNSRIQVSNTALSLGSSFTVAGWAKRNSTTNASFQALYDSGEQNNEWWIFIADGGAAGTTDRLGFGRRGVGDSFSSDANFADTNWHHFAVVISGTTGSNLTFYVDGVARGTASVGAVSTPVGPQQIGILQDGAFVAPMNGFIDDLRVYNRVLSATEVQRLAQGGGCVTDGLSWNSAFRELQCALAVDANGDMVKVATGRYRPGAVAEVSFPIDRNISLLGGYAGVGAPTPDSRPAFDPNAADSALTVLTGDLFGDDNPFTFANYTENAFHVLTVAPGAAPALDGFRVRGGNAVKPRNGGGLRVDAGAAAVDLTNMAFFANRTTASGGAIFAQAPLRITSSTFLSNTGGSINDFGSGGAIAITATLQLTHTNFLSNTMHGGDGGAVDSKAPVTVNGGHFQGNVSRLGGLGQGGAINGTKAVTVTGASFLRNLAGGSGGAVAGGTDLMVIASSSFTRNETFSSGGAIEHSGALEIRNSSFLSNTTTFFGGAVDAGGYDRFSQILNSTFTGNIARGANCNFPPPTGPLCTRTSGQGAGLIAFGAVVVEGSTFVNNQAKIDGGAIAAQGPATVRSTTLTLNKAGFPPGADNSGLGNGGGIFATDVLTVENVTLSQNQAQMVGGGMFITGSAQISGSLVNLNSALAGGGLALSGSGSVTGTTFLSNTASNAGGGMIYSGGTLAVQGGSFIGNSITSGTGSGGGLGTAAGTIQLTGTLFSGNTAPFGGGLNNLNAFLQLVNTQFLTNQASVSGGGLFNTATLIDNGSYLAHNRAPAGAGMTMEQGDNGPGTGELRDTLFFSNTAVAVGGGLSAIGPVTLTQVHLVENLAAGGGGGAFVLGSALISDTLFERNVTTATASHGGGLFIQNGPALVASSTFTGNLAMSTGGGALVARTTVQDSVFRNNRALNPNSEAGGLRGRTALTVTHSVFAGNVSQLSGGVVADGAILNPIPVLIADSLFTGNARLQGSGAADMRLLDVSLQLINNTFADPASANSFSTVAFRGSGQAANNIFANYAFGLAVDISSTVTASHNLLFNAPFGSNVITGSGNLVGNPQFVDAAARDYRLRFNSPALDGGSDAAVPAGLTTDLDGLPRFFDVTAIAGAGIVDMGAFEYRNQFPVTVAGGPYSGNEGSPVALNGAGSSDDKGIVAFAWDCTNDGSFEVVASQPAGSTCTYPDNGTFTLRLRTLDTEQVSTVATTSVTVLNVAPAITKPANQSATVGENRLFALGSFTDPGPDAPWQVVVDWGDGTADTQFAVNSAQTLPHQAHTFGTPGSFTVQVTVTDKDGGSQNRSFTVSAVAPNQSPSAAAGGPYSGSEGSPVALDGTQSSDDQGIASFAWDCTNDGSFDVTRNGPTGASCTYADNGNFTVRLRTVDAQSAGDESTAGVAIANVAPALTRASNQSSVAGARQLFALGRFTDPGADAPWQVVVDWGDGTANTAFSVNSPQELPLKAHRYDTAGSYSVTVTVTDKDGGAQSRGFTVAVTAQGGFEINLPVIIR